MFICIINTKKMSPYLIKALVATEDERFYEHSGIDFRALGRAIVKRGILGQTNGGRALLLCTLHGSI